MFGRGKMQGLWAERDASATECSIPPETRADTRRNRQKNLKASPACMAAFAHLAKVSQMSEAALFEDLVAQRWEELRGSRGFK